MLVGSIGLMAFMFSVVTIGLFAYSIQLAWQGLTGRKPSDAGDSAPDISEMVAAEREGEKVSQVDIHANEDLTNEKGDASATKATS